jgi:nucleoside phosphorylase
MKRIALIFALPMEARPFLRAVGGGKLMTTKENSALVLADRTAVAVGVSGLGAVRASAKASEILADGPDALIFAGFAGALSADMNSGDLVISECVVDATIEPSVCRHADAGLLQQASACAGHGGREPLVRRMLTVSAPVKAPEEKARLLEDSGCGAVDMESGAAAGVAAELHVPFLAVRAIVDRQEDVLPRVFAEGLRADGSVDATRIARALIRDPGSVAAAIKLARQANTASRALASFLIEFLSRI